MSDRAEILRKRAAERSRKRYPDALKGAIPYLCADCRLEYEAPPGHAGICPRCGAHTKTGHAR